MPQIFVIYGLEGCDYLTDINDLDTLYKLGLRSVNIVWNNPNQYASGIRGDYGLTESGKTLIDKLIKLNIGIDLSHVNEKTFDDIIELVKNYRQKGIFPIIYASHSNSKKLCNRARNLSDSQLLKLKEVDGYVGVMSNKNFVEIDAIDKNLSLDILRKKYIQHIIHIGNIIGFDKVFLSTDDMNFSSGDPIYKQLSIYDYSKIKEELSHDLLCYLDYETVENILQNNSKFLLEKLNINNLYKK